MSMSPKILFIPVSSAEGIGEYMRSLILADGVKKKWPNATIKFVLSREAPYAETCPYPAEILKRSPTKEVQPVKDILTEFKPDIAIFDASGRASQLRHAKKVGAKVIFISQHRRKRSRGMRLNRAFAIDAHLVAQPEFAIGPISVIDKIKLKLFKIEKPICIGPVFAEPDEKIQDKLLEKFNLTRNEYVIFNAGSGGHLVGEKLAADIFAEAAAAGYQKTKIKCLFVYGPNYPKTPTEHEGVQVIQSLDNTEFINLLSAAKAAVLSGGDTLLQSIALKVPTLAIPVSKDQPPRIKTCTDNQFILSSDCAPENILEAYLELNDPSKESHLLKTSDVKNGTYTSLSKIEKILKFNK